MTPGLLGGGNLLDAPRRTLLDAVKITERAQTLSRVPSPFFGKCTRYSGARIDSLEVRQLW